MIFAKSPQPSPLSSSEIKASLSMYPAPPWAPTFFSTFLDAYQMIDWKISWEQFIIQAQKEINKKMEINSIFFYF